MEETIIENTLFENTTVITEAMMKKAAQVSGGKQKARYTAFAIAFLCVGLFNLWERISGSNGASIAIALLTGVVMPMAVLFTYRKQLRARGQKLYDIYRKNSKPEGVLNYAFYQDGFGLVTGKRHAYSQIVKFVEYPEEWVALLPSTVLPIAKNGFTKGEGEAFARFMRERVPTK